jgi:hypothetical protein
MTQHEIIWKLNELLTGGIDSESEAMYFVVELRKVLEHQGKKSAYQYLTFHCDWAVHAKLQGPTAQSILRHFDAANTHFKSGVELHDLPLPLRREVEGISKMRYFEKELEGFSKDNGLPPLHHTRPDGWPNFLHHYVKIVENCPLVMSAKDSGASIASVTLKTELARKRIHGETFYKVTWVVKDKSGETGEVYVINSFSARSRSASQPLR